MTLLQLLLSDEDYLTLICDKLKPQENTFFFFLISHWTVTKIVHIRVTKPQGVSKNWDQTGVESDWKPMAEWQQEKAQPGASRWHSCKEPIGQRGHLNRKTHTQNREKGNAGMWGLREAAKAVPRGRIRALDAYLGNEASNLSAHLKKWEKNNPKASREKGIIKTRNWWHWDQQKNVFLIN
jgi:hypothetical protein